MDTIERMEKLSMLSEADLNQVDSMVDALNNEPDQIFLIAHDAPGSTPGRLRFLFRAERRYILGTIRGENGLFSYGIETIGELQAFDLWKNDPMKHDVDLPIAFPEMMPFLNI